MIKKVYDFVQNNKMLNQVNTVVAGLSGGADSVCLLLVLMELKKRYKLSYKLIAVHVNHHIRGAEAMRYKEFARQLCERYGIPFICESVQVPQLAKEQGLTEEEAGRKARYEIFAKIAGEYQTQCGQAVIAVAHHRNDQAETVLMNLMRGSGLRGMCGIQPVRLQGKYRIIRPLLCVTRQEIEEYLSDISQKYITDSTNNELEFTRNKIRYQLIPFLRDEFNPNIVSTICDLSENLSQAEVYIEKQASTLYKSAVIRHLDERHNSAEVNVAALVQSDPLLGTYVIRKVLTELANAQKDLYRSHVEKVFELCRLSVGKKVSLPYGLTAVRKYDSIFITNHIVKEVNEEKKDFLIRISKDKLNRLKCGEQIIVVVNRNIYVNNRGYVFIKNINIQFIESLENSLNNVYTKYFDYDKMKSNIYLRFRRTGDSIVIHTNGASKKLKKELIDRKVPQEDRNNILLLTDKEHILWAIGIRRGEDNRVDSHSRRILKISVELQEE